MPAKRALSVNEQILIDAARIYDLKEEASTDAKDLISYAKYLSRTDAFTKDLPKHLLERAKNMRPPRDRITVLLVGNHSAGKSSFINWYVGEKIQNESVAIETAGITIVRRGKSRVSWKGPQTVSAFTYLEKLAKLEGMVDFLSTEFSLSTEKNFSTVEFIDTPGLTDGTLKYPFDVDEAVMELAEHATMVMVFLDPIGKALVGRCMKVVEKLAVKHSAKMTYYLAKFDTAGDEVDRTNVVSQIVQELQGRVKATHALKLHTIYLPERAGDCKVPNKIDELCQNISREIDSRVQDVLENLSKDCDALSQLVDSKVERNKTAVAHNMRSGLWKAILFSLGGFFLAAGVYWALLNHAALDPMDICQAGDAATESTTLPDGSVVTETKAGPTGENIYCFALKFSDGIPAVVMLVLGLLWTIYMWIVKTKPEPQLSSEEMRKLRAIQDDIKENIIQKHKVLKKRLYEDAIDSNY